MLGATVGLSLDTLNRLQGLDGQQTRVVIEGLVALVFLVMFVLREKRIKHPLMNISLLRKPSFCMPT